MDSDLDFHAALAALAWQVELGAEEACGEAPVNRFAAGVEPAPALPEAEGPQSERAAPERPGSERGAPAPVTSPSLAAQGPLAVAVAASAAAAAAAGTPDALRDALAAYPHCDLRRGAKSLVFADGRPGARVMLVGDAPGRDDDQQGRPFAGRAGLLLDRMFAAIGLARNDPDPARALYLTDVLPWRPPQDRAPSADEIAMLSPFLLRHVALADPAVVVLMGNAALAALLGTKGITRLRGQWAEVLGRPALAMCHPDHLLRTPEAKREAWADLLALQARLRGIP